MKKISEIKRMFEEEERLLEESHKQTVKRHNEIMAAIEKASQGKPTNKKAALEYMNTGKCPFAPESCPEDLLDDEMEEDEICWQCIARHFKK